MKPPFAIGALLLLFVASARAADADWPMLGHDPGRSGATDTQVRPPFERKWFRFSQGTWAALLVLLAASATGLSGGGGPLAKRTSKTPGLEVKWERVVRARSVAQWRFTVEAPAGEARLTLADGLAVGSTLRDISPPPKSVIAGKDALTLVYEVDPGSAATVRMDQALQSPGLLRSTIRSGASSLNLEQIVLP